MEAEKPEGERVRKNTATSQNKKIDDEIVRHIAYYGNRSKPEISYRIKQLDKEWDIERVLEVNMSVIALAGIVLTIFIHSYWLILPSIVLLFFIQHAIQGWCPPIPLFRALKVRTRPEIDREKYALKVLRGDFSNININSAQVDARSVLNAAKLI